MGTEIERKFLVRGDGWRAMARGTLIRQGYLVSLRERSVRVRIFGNAAFLTVKGEKSGLVRAEYEYAIPVADAAEMLDQLCERPLIEKTRYAVSHDGIDWIVDVFEGDNAGLVLAEVELETADQLITLPDWLGPEVSSDPRYLNVNLVARPYRTWPAAEKLSTGAAAPIS